VLTDNAGRKRPVVPCRDLPDDEWGRWWRARARSWARFFVTRRNAEPPILGGGYDVDRVADPAPDSAGDEDEDEIGDAEADSRIEQLYALASPQQAAMLDEILAAEVSSLADIDRRLQLTKGQAAVQLRRLRMKCERAGMTAW
jgi:DNA-directed RNA polymerase specialized sigma24 family protein